MWHSLEWVPFSRAGGSRERCAQQLFCRMAGQRWQGWAVQVALEDLPAGTLPLADQAPPPTAASLSRRSASVNSQLHQASSSAGVQRLGRAAPAALGQACDHPVMLHSCQRGESASHASAR